MPKRAYPQAPPRLRLVLAKQPFAQAEQAAKRLKLSRSELYSRASSEYLARHTDSEVNATMTGHIMASSGILSPARYKKLLGDLQELLDAAESAAAGQRIEGFWRVGERIERERLDREVGYHNAVMKDLAADSGVGLRNLQRALIFHQTYRKPPEPNGLTWSHYRALLTLENRVERTYFEKLTVTEGLSVRELEAAIRQGMDGDPEETPPLERPTDPSYLYRARVYAVVDGDTIDFMVDLGFQTFREQRIRLADIILDFLATVTTAQLRHTQPLSLLPAAN